jgi:hypothetical protein
MKCKKKKKKKKLSVMELVYTKWYSNQQMHAKIMGKYSVYKSIINDIIFLNKLKITVLSLLIKLIMMTSIRRQRDPTYTDKVGDNRKKICYLSKCMHQFNKYGMWYFWNSCNYLINVCEDPGKIGHHAAFPCVFVRGDWIGPMGIRVRTDLPHPCMCRKRRLKGVILQMR